MFHTIAVLAYRVVMAIAGLSVLSACLLTEVEEDRVQNRLLAWWVRLDDSRERLRAGSHAFASRLAHGTNEILNAAFGERIISVQAIGVSACLSITSMYLFAWLVWRILDSAHVGSRVYFRFAPVGIVVPILLVLLAARLKLFRPITLLGVPFLMLCVASWVATAWMLIFGVVWDEDPVGGILAIFPPNWEARLATVTTLAAFVSAGCDVVTIALIRSAYRALRGIQRPWLTLLMLVCVGVASLSIASVPLTLALCLRHSFHDTTYSVLALSLASATNLLGASLGVLWIGVAVPIWANTFAYEMLSRSLYAAERHRVVAKKRMLWVLGGTLVALAFPDPILNRLLGILGAK